MPTYEYVCDACDHKFELFQSIKDDPITKCPECRKKKLRRLFGTGVAVVFKGSGFYQTDYRSDAYKKSAAAESKSESGGSSSDAKSSESKSSEPKSESKASSNGSSSAKTKKAKSD
jgi:putative FmdB family regulatory protein